MADAGLIDLAAERLGGCVVRVSDEFFADASNLLVHADPVWREGEYTDRGKWMDGWESRRRRDAGNDFCLIALGAPGVIREAVVETTHFRGNHPEACSILGVWAPDVAADETSALDGEDWFPILERSPLEGDRRHGFPVEGARPATHVRLDIFPDGGVARLRLMGTVVVDWDAIAAASDPVDLAGLVSGGSILAASDAAFGDPHNLLLPSRARNMGEGWETRRRRGPGHDWAVVRLGHRGRVDRIEICTEHFKGNYPAEASVDLCDAADADAPPEDAWRPAVGRTPLSADRLHVFEDLDERGPATHARLSIYPDGGVARLRVVGRPATES